MFSGASRFHRDPLTQLHDLQSTDRCRLGRSDELRIVSACTGSRRFELSDFGKTLSRHQAFKNSGTLRGR